MPVFGIFVPLTTTKYRLSYLFYTNKMLNFK